MNNKKISLSIIILIFSFLLIAGCNKKKNSTKEDTPSDKSKSHIQQGSIDAQTTSSIKKKVCEDMTEPQANPQKNDLDVRMESKAAQQQRNELTNQIIARLKERGFDNLDTKKEHISNLLAAGLKKQLDTTYSIDGLSLKELKKILRFSNNKNGKEVECGGLIHGEHLTMLYMCDLVAQFKNQEIPKSSTKIDVTIYKKSWSLKKCLQVDENARSMIKRPSKTIKDK